MTTRKQLIVEKYTQLRTDLANFAPDNAIFPSLDDIDVTDLFFFVNMHFSNGKVREGVAEILEIYNIEVSADKMRQIIPIIEEFITWFKTLM
jgi:hypothetical protein